MTCKQANDISIIDFLFTLGVEPKKIVGNNHWYLSPLREENTPSFKVDSNLNRWYDHGLGIGGKLVDLGIRFFEIEIAQFLTKIESWDFSKSFSFQKPEKIIEPVIKKIKALENIALIEYLETRAIPIQLASVYCQEIYYCTNGKNYFGISFKNDSGGYEIRSKYFKGCLRQKSISSSIVNIDQPVILFEGFVDFLTVCKHGGVNSNSSWIVLNSVNQVNQAIEVLMRLNLNTVETYFDNDEAGKKCFLTVKNLFTNVTDHSHSYQKFKDINEMETHKSGIKAKRIEIGGRCI